MSPRATTLLLLIAAAAAPAEPETDPFLAAMAGKSGPEAVAAPSFDPDVEAASWTLRPRREIVDALAARLLRGEAKAWFDKGGGTAAPAPAGIPNRFPPGFEAGEFTISDRLAARVPADAAAVFFGSLDEAETAVEKLAKFLPRSLPGVFADAPGGRRDALDFAVAELLVPTIWRSNPGVRRGTRQAALLAADPDLRWNPEIALVVEVDDASLVRFHRLSTLSFEDRGARRLRVDGLDATSDDGSVRSFFGLEGGIAVWSTGRNFRDRILAAASGKAPTLLSPDPRAYALARRTFPAATGEPLLVIPDGFLERANSVEFRGRRAAALRCDAIRLVAAGRALGKTQAPLPAGVRLDCVAGGTIRVAAGSAQATCSVHGRALHRVPLGDLPESPMSNPPQIDTVLSGVFPVAVTWRAGALEVLVSPGDEGISQVELVRPPDTWTEKPGGEPSVLERLDRIHSSGFGESATVSAHVSMFGEAPESTIGGTVIWNDGRAAWTWGRSAEILMRGQSPPRRPEGGVLRIGELKSGNGLGGSGSGIRFVLPLEWR